MIKITYIQFFLMLLSIITIAKQEKTIPQETIFQSMDTNRKLKRIVRKTNPKITAATLLFGSLYFGYRGAFNLWITCLSSIAMLFPYKIKNAKKDIKNLKKRIAFGAHTGFFFTKSSAQLALATLLFQKSQKIETLLRD